MRPYRAIDSSGQYIFGSLLVDTRTYATAMHLPGRKLAIMLVRCSNTQASIEGCLPMSFKPVSGQHCQAIKWPRNSCLAFASSTKNRIFYVGSTFGSLGASSILGGSNPRQVSVPPVLLLLCCFINVGTVVPDIAPLPLIVSGPGRS